MEKRDDNVENVAKKITFYRRKWVLVKEYLIIPDVLYKSIEEFDIAHVSNICSPEIEEIEIYV